MKIDKQVAAIAFTKLKGHLLYLSEDLIGLALFSHHVNNDEKKAIVAGLQKTEMKNDIRRVDPKSVDCFQAKTLADFVTKRSLNLFQALKLDSNFLSSDPATWSTNVS